MVYVDLWEDRRAAPGDVIVHAVRAELSRHDGVVKRLARSAGMERVTVGGVAFSLDGVGLGEGVSLSAALSDETGRVIVLIVDEAQHAITSERGNDALFALKAARDELNSSRHKGLRVVATGSSRDKLATLRNGSDQAFYGAPLVNLPPLGPDYVAWFCKRVGLAAPLDPAMVEGFVLACGLPAELAGAAADTLRFEFCLVPRDVPARFEPPCRNRLSC